jgi:predicted phage terminase large subunit-like protein
MAATGKADAKAFNAADEAWRGKIWNYAYYASDGDWLPYTALQVIADVVQAAIRKGGGRIIINIPPRHGKSELISHWLPVWFLDHFAHKNVILTSYGDKLAAKYGRMVRDEFRMNQNTWTNIGTRDTVNDWITTEGGGMRTAGVGGPIIGFGADLFVIDDPHKNREEVQSVIMRDKVIDWFNSVVYSRLEPDATIVLIMQRWHDRDLTGYLLHEHEDDWLHIKMPAVCEDTNDLLSRNVGDSLIPERYNEMDLHQIKTAVGSLVWAGMYQQRPAPEEGNIILRDWIQYYMRFPSDIGRVVVSWDMNFKKTGKSMCVGQVWHQKGSSHYLLHQERGRWDFPTALAKTVALYNYCTERWGHVKETMIEEAANGIGIIATIKGKMPRVKGIKVSTSKIERMSDASPSVECGDVWVPHKSIAHWVDGLVDEWVTFPNADLDDQCDAFSQYINRYKVKKIGHIKMNMDVGVAAPEWRLN